MECFISQDLVLLEQKKICLLNFLNAGLSSMSTVYSMLMGDRYFFVVPTARYIPTYLQKNKYLPCVLM